MDGPAVEDDDPAEVRAPVPENKQADTNTVNMRSYDLYITYDRYYQVGRSFSESNCVALNLEKLYFFANLAETFEMCFGRI